MRRNLTRKPARSKITEARTAHTHTFSVSGTKSTKLKHIDSTHKGLSLPSRMRVRMQDSNNGKSRNTVGTDLSGRRPRSRRCLASLGRSCKFLALRPCLRHYTDIAPVHVHVHAHKRRNRDAGKFRRCVGLLLRSLVRLFVRLSVRCTVASFSALSFIRPSVRASVRPSARWYWPCNWAQTFSSARPAKDYTPAYPEGPEPNVPV